MNNTLKTSGMLIRAWLLISGVVVFGCSSVQARDVLSTRYAVGVQKDIQYGTGIVDASSDAKTRPLMMDYYYPTDKNAPKNRPALILAFGGSFHRGSKDGEAITGEDGFKDSPMADYCRAFAARGYSCFTIDYRLTQEDPGLDTPIDPQLLMNSTDAVAPRYTSRIDIAREFIGLPPLDDTTRKHLWNAILAASEDMHKALHTVRNNAKKFSVDPQRIAVGGWSAGAITANNIGLGGDDSDKVAAVISISGSFWGYDIYRNLKPESNPGEHPSVLLLAGENDLPGILYSIPLMLPTLQRAEVDYEFAWVPGRGHFYDYNAITLADDGSKIPLLERMETFLARSFSQKK